MVCFLEDAEHFIFEKLDEPASAFSHGLVNPKPYDHLFGRAMLCACSIVRDLIENRDSTARDHLANERTFLAWVRTALGLVGLGVLLERLGAGGEAIAVAAGLGFISFGGLSLIYAVSRYLWVAKHLEHGMFPVAIRGPIVVAFGAILVAGGAMLYVLLLH